jgi:[ribosomal protein S5]-alanine N-acetyltransferase
MSYYRLAIPSDNVIDIIYEWETSEKNYSYIAGKTVSMNWAYDEYFKKMKETIENSKRPYRVLVNQNNEVLGCVKGYNYQEQNNSILIGFYIPEINRNKGYGTKMLELFVNELFIDKSLNLNRIIASTVETNEGSKKILEKNLFVLEGKLRENMCIDGVKFTEYYYSILRSEWERNLTTASISFDETSVNM